MFLGSLFLEIINTSVSSKNEITQPRANLDISLSTLPGVVDVTEDEGKACVLMGDFNINLLQ